MPIQLVEKLIKGVTEPCAVTDTTGKCLFSNKAFDVLFETGLQNKAHRNTPKIKAVIDALTHPDTRKRKVPKGVISAQGQDWRLSVYKLSNWENDETLFIVTALDGASSGEKGDGAGRHQSRQKISLMPEFENLIGEDPVFVKALVQAQKAAKTNHPVLLMGESGTGKEVLARTVHMASRRKKQAFVDVNCAAIPDSLVESELFGYEKGSFTGANPGGQKGYFESAHGGSIFMDEIGEAAPTTQAKLLRVLQDGKFKRVGSNKNISVDVRLISATNQKLESRIDEGHFRKDLFYRINTITIHLPPLRHRRNDLPLLVDHFLKNKISDQGESLHFSKEAMAVLLSYQWPGNVRELKGVVDYAVTMTTEPLITPESLPGFVRPDMAALTIQEENDLYSTPSEIDNDALAPLLRSVERAHMKRILDQSNNRTEAIRRLGISRRSFYIKIKQYQLE